MKLWLIRVAAAPGSNGGEEMMELIQFIHRIRKCGQSWLMSKKRDMRCAAIVTDDEWNAERIEDSWKEHWTGIAGKKNAPSVDAMPMCAREMLDVFAEHVGMNLDVLEEMYSKCYGPRIAEKASEEPARVEKPGFGGIEVRVSVDGVNEAVKHLKVLEAQLHGVQAQAKKIGEMIDGLQLRLDNRIESMRPDR